MAVSGAAVFGNPLIPTSSEILRINDLDSPIVRATHMWGQHLKGLTVLSIPVCAVPREYPAAQPLNSILELGKLSYRDIE